MRIIARCTLRLDAPLHIRTPASRFIEGIEETDNTDGVFVGPEWPTVSANSEEIEVKITLKPNAVMNPFSYGHKMLAIDNLIAEVKADVPVFIPTDFDIFEPLRQRLNRALLETSNRLVDYFRYRLGNPLIRSLDYGSKGPWTFYDESGTKLYEEGSAAMVLHDFFPGLPGTKYALGSRALRPEDIKDLNAFISDPAMPSTVLTLRAQARDAVLLGDVNVAVLLLAVCAEVAIKSSFFRRDAVVAEAYDYLEEKRQVEVTPVELITQVARRAFGISFKEHDASACRDVEYLFRCRNKVAHRGHAIFRDQSGAQKIPDQQLLLDWWEAVDRLIQWLEVAKDSSPSMS